MNKTCRLVELRPDRFLLDASFDGYKLSLDPIPIYRQKIEPGVVVRQPSDSQYSFCHTKLFSLHNHFHFNPHRPDCVYYVDKNLRIYRVTLSTTTQNQILTSKVCEIPESQQSSGCYNVSIAFPSADSAVVSDGRGVAYLARILEQNNTEIWEIDASKCLFKEEFGFILTDARIEDKETLNVLLTYVEEKAEKDDSKEGHFQTVIKWKKSVKENDWSDKVLSVNGSIDYLVFEPDCKSIYVISDKPPKWIFDSGNPIKVDEEVIEPVKKIYSWTQTKDEITLWVPISEGLTKTDFDIHVNDLNLEIKSKGDSMLKGDFHQRIDKSLTSWNFSKQQIEFQFAKQEEGLMWETLLKGDNQGEEILDPELVKNVHEKLAHLCSSEEEKGDIPTTLNSQQLEECDASSSSSSLFRIEDTHLTTHEVTLSTSQWLFKVHCTPNETPAICCRHDVDACVWQFSKPEPESQTWNHKHIGTFSAFGYVQASKNQKKFLASSPDLSYVVVCDVTHRIYVYRQQTPVTGELKNRHTGKKVKTVSKQQLVNLETAEHILGVHATNNLLFVLLENTICVLVINE